MRFCRSALILMMAFRLAASGLCSAESSDFDLQLLQTEILKTIDRVRPAVVHLIGKKTAFSGVIVSPQGHVLSVAHGVTPGMEYRVVLPDGRKLRGVGMGVNPWTDAALVKITNPDDDLPYVPMGDSASLVNNQPALGLSYPEGQASSMGPVVRFGRVVRSYGNGGLLQSSVLMEPGDSGGPLFDLNGCVIGIHSRIGQSMDRNYEVPIDLFRAHWNELNREKSFTRSGPQTQSLGLQFRPAEGSDNEMNTKKNSNSGDQEDMDLNEVNSEEQIDEKPENEGLFVAHVMPGGLGAAAGVLHGDRIVQFYDRPIQTMADLLEALKAGRKDEAKAATIKLVRKNEKANVEMTVDLSPDPAPKVSLPEGDHPSVPASHGFRELNRFAKQFSDLEDRLDDACVKITSDAGEDVSLTITGTRIKGTPWIVSKNSVVGQNPKIQGEDDDELISLEVVQRNAVNDLVLLRAPQKNKNGIDLKTTEKSVSVGTFLLTPDDDGEGFVSVVGTPSFRSRKRSRGFLDVVPSTYKQNQGAYIGTVNEGGAASRAGLMVGDVITKMNESLIRSQADLRKFLSQADPNNVITATILRVDDQLTKSITLGAVPSGSTHTADKIDKSGRRDGFQQVFSHDADLDPQECGGPLFDLAGNFVGLNVARNSRTRSFALPANMLKAFVDQAASQKLP